MAQSDIDFAVSVKKEIAIAMTAPEVAYLIQSLSSGKVYFEFGCGGSTMVAATYGPSDLNITSVDSSLEWITTVRRNEKCEAKKASNLMRIDLVDIGPVEAWGFPTQKMHESKGAWYLYSQAISMAEGKYDVVLVDGRFRVACVINTFISNPEAKVMIHDFFETTHHLHYKILLAVSEVVERVDTLVQLRKKPGITQVELMKMYAAYMHEPARK